LHLQWASTLNEWGYFVKKKQKKIPEQERRKDLYIYLLGRKIRGRRITLSFRGLDYTIRTALRVTCIPKRLI